MQTIADQSVAASLVLIIYIAAACADTTGDRLRKCHTFCVHEDKCCTLRLAGIKMSLGGSTRHTLLTIAAAVHTVEK